MSNLCPCQSKGSTGADDFSRGIQQPHAGIGGRLSGVDAPEQVCLAADRRRARTHQGGADWIRRIDPTCTESNVSRRLSEWQQCVRAAAVRVRSMVTDSRTGCNRTLLTLTRTDYADCIPHHL